MQENEFAREPVRPRRLHHRTTAGLDRDSLARGRYVPSRIHACSSAAVGHRRLANDLRVGGILTAFYIWHRDISVLILAHVMTGLYGLVIMAPQVGCVGNLTTSR
jgi:hypothetical protein